MRKTILTLAIIILSFGCTKDDMNNIQAPIPAPKVVSTPKEIVLDSARVDFNAGARDGGAASADDILFLGSLTIDNFLKSETSNGTIQRKHEIFDKDDVAYLQITLGLLNTINIDGVFLKHYKVLFMYKDSTHENRVAYVKALPTDNFKYIFTGENLLKTGHPSKEISYTATGQTKVYYNEVRATNHVPPNGLKRWQLRMDGSPIKADYKEPTSRNNTQYQPAHSF